MDNEFINQLKTSIPAFLEAVEEKLPFVRRSYADHVCWRTETKVEYNDLIASLNKHPGATLLIESIIGGRPIATFKLHEGITCCSNRRIITVLEIPSPKEGSFYSTGLEHVEFTLGTEGVDCTSPINDINHQSKLQAFMEEHPEIKNWNEKALTKDVNPDVSIKIDLPEFGICSVKFHLLPLEKVIEYELSLVMT